LSRIQKALEQAKLNRQPETSSGTLADATLRRKRLITPNVTKGDGKRLVDLELRAVQPSVEALHENRVVSNLIDSKSNAVDAYKMLRTKTLRSLVSNQWRILAITSTVQGEGKTLTALNLALSISQDPNFDVVLVDADLRSSSIHSRLGIQPALGLSDYLEGKAELSDILLSPGVEGLGIIPNLHSIENSSEALASARMRELMADLRSLSPAVIVIVDMPPLIVDDVLAFAPLVDALLLVFRAGITSRADISAARELTADLPVVGCVVNGAHSTNSETYY
jgi:protein-tyrosine kinase